MKAFESRPLQLPTQFLAQSPGVILNHPYSNVVAEQWGPQDARGSAAGYLAYRPGDGLPIGVYAGDDKGNPVPAAATAGWTTYVLVAGIAYVIFSSTRQ